MAKKTISKVFDLKITSGYIYSLQFGTTVTEDVEVANDEEFQKESERIFKEAKIATRKDAADMLPALRALASQPVTATSPKQAEAISDLKSLVIRLEAMGIK